MLTIACSSWCRVLNPDRSRKNDEWRFLRESVIEYKGRKLHWIDALAEYLDNIFRSRSVKNVVVNGGLSVSGLQHVGRLRGEIIINDILASLLEEKGYNVKRMLTLYTQDAWKGKEGQLAQFPSPEEAKKYIGWPLIRVPDPKGELPSWVDRYWADFGPYIDKFTREHVEVVTTTDLYKGKLLEFTKIVISKREKVRDIVNKYRKRKPYPEGWIPFEPRCGKCGRIDTTIALSVDLEKDVVQYECKNCGHKGETHLWDGKLNWRIEWVGVWWALEVSFEPYGKDHAVPGGSRDSANELAKVVFNINPPEGIAYEWVAIRLSSGKEQDMGSSDFIGFTPKEWLEVATPELMRFLVLKTPPMRKLTLSLREIPLYYDLYFKAERIYYGFESTGKEDEDLIMKRSYELSYVRGQPPEKLPVQVGYTHLAILSQVVPKEKWETEAIKRLQRSGHIAATPSRFDIDRVLDLLPRAHNWATKYAPDHYKVTIIQEVNKDIMERIPREYRESIVELGKRLDAIEEWNEESIKNTMIEFTREWGSQKRKEFYKYIYILFTGKDSGPRVAPLFSLLPKDFVIRRLLLEG